MKSLSSVAALFLGLVAIAASGVAWHQYRRAEQLERDLAARPAVTATVAQAASPQPAVDPAEEEIDEPREQAAHAGAPGSEQNRRPNEGPRPDPSGRFSALMENPEYLTAWQAQQRGFIDSQYAGFFRRMNLNSAQIERLKDLLVERAASRMDVMNAARREGLTGRDSRDDVRALVQQAENEIARDIQSVLGESGAAQLQQYEQTAPQRHLVNQVSDRLSYSATPLTAAQQDALVSILAETSPSPRTTGPSGLSPINRGPGGSVISDAAIARAQGVLSPSQVEALREIQAQQRAQRQMSEIMRREMRNQRPNPTPGG